MLRALPGRTILGPAFAPDNPNRGIVAPTALTLCDLGQGCPELGYVSLREIESLRGTLGLKVERDLHFEADRTLSAYAQLAHERSAIIT